MVVYYICRMFFHLAHGSDTGNTLNAAIIYSFKLVSFNLCPTVWISLADWKWSCLRQRYDKLHCLKYHTFYCHYISNQTNAEFLLARELFFPNKDICSDRVPHNAAAKKLTTFSTRWQHRQDDLHSSTIHTCRLLLYTIVSSSKMCFF